METLGGDWYYTTYPGRHSFAVLLTPCDRLRQGYLQRDPFIRCQWSQLTQIRVLGLIITLCRTGGTAPPTFAQISAAASHDAMRWL